MPDLAGKIRSFFSISSMRNDIGAQPGFANPTSFAHYFNTAHNQAGVPPSYTSESPGGPNFSAGPQRAFLWGFGFHERSGFLPGTGNNTRYPGSGTKPVVAGIASRSLNTTRLSPAWYADNYRTPESQRILAGHKWIHVNLIWRLDPGTATRSAQIFINGRSAGLSTIYERQPFPADPRLECACSGFCWGSFTGDPWNDTTPYKSWQAHHSYHWFWDKVDRNGVAWRPTTPGRASNTPPDDWVIPVRIGEPTALTNRTQSGNLYSRNFSPDSTVDEFWLWGDADKGRTGADALWRQGRYYRGNNAEFFSQSLDLNRPNSTRLLTPRQGATSGTPGTAPVLPQPEIVGVSWTMQAKKYDSSRPLVSSAPGMNRFIQYDYGVPNIDVPGTWLRTGVELAISPEVVSGGPPFILPTRWYGQNGPVGLTTRLRDSSWSVPDEDPSPAVFRRVRVPINPATRQTRLKYRAYFRMTRVTGAFGTPILLETPVLDDVTLYFTTGAPQILDWVIL